MAHIGQTEIRRLDFTLLLVMQGLLRHRRTTAVAAELGLSQSAISYALSRLRTSFGDRLFIRRPHGLEPTPRALELGVRIDAIVEGAREALGLGDEFDAATTTRVFRLAVLDLLAAVIGPPLLRAFERQAPNARFALQTLRGAEALEALRRGQADVALGQFLRPLDGFIAAPLAEDRYVLAARAGHPNLAAPVTAASFQALRHVLISVEGDFRSLTDQPIQGLGLSRRIVATAPTFPIAFAMVGGSEAVCVAPRRLARAYVERFGLALHELPRALRPIQLLAVRADRRDAGAEWLLRLAAACAGEAPG